MPRPDVSEERKSQILQAALQVFARKGFTSTRMDDISSEAGLSVGILYWYYKGKLEITLALIKMLLPLDDSLRQTLLTSPEPCRARLWRLFSDGAGDENVSLWAELYHLAAREPRVSKVLKKYIDQYQSISAQLIEQGIASGELRADLDSQSAAFTLQTLFDGFMLNLTVNSKMQNFQALFKQSFDLLFDGLEV
jgi:AcrR family transcriptional regulator